MTKRKRNPVTTDALARRMYRMEERVRFDCAAVSNILAHGMETHFRLLNAEIRAIKSAQETLDHRLDMMHKTIEATRSASWKDHELLKEVNAHMWQTQNRLGAVRDILTGKYTVTKKAEPKKTEPHISIWARYRKFLKP